MAQLIYAGQRITADQLNALVALAAIKAGDQHYTNTTFTNDTDLALQVDANANYLFDSVLFIEGGTNGSSDCKFQWTVPTGAVLSVAIPAYYFTDGQTHGPSYIAAGNSFVVGTQGAGIVRPVVMRGSLVMGSTAGTVQLKAAKNSSGSTDAIIHLGSTLDLQEVG
jgi:hypothetical protein